MKSPDMTFYHMVPSKAHAASVVACPNSDYYVQNSQVSVGTDH